MTQLNLMNRAWMHGGSQRSQIPAGWIGEPRLLKGVRDVDLTDLRAHRSVHGRLRLFHRAELLQLLRQVSLIGRGGAAFPIAAKLESMGESAATVVVNGCEGEPISAKDRLLLSTAPHLVLDGAIIVAAALGAANIRVAVTDPALAYRLVALVGQRTDAPRTTVDLLPDRFVSGEARALVRALSGGPAVPPGRRVLPTVHGVDGRPTLLSNAETFAQLALLCALGPGGFASVGTAAEPGTTLITVSGAVASPGVLEVPIGTTLASVAATVGALPSQAVVVGGYHGAWLPGDPNILLSRADLTARGGTLGAGALAFVGEQTCGVAELHRVASWLAGESVKQCGPCRFGLPALVDDLAQLLAGRPTQDLARRHAMAVTGRGACAHPDGAARFIETGLRVLASDVGKHLAYGNCRQRDHGHLALTTESAMQSRPGVRSGQPTAVSS